MKKTQFKSVSTFRKDILSGEWILVATGRRSRPGAEKIKSEKRTSFPIGNCPFENPQENNETAVLWYAKPEVSASDSIDDWFLQVIPNKYPVLSPHQVCPVLNPVGPYQVMDGVGFHEVIITRDHEKTMADMTIGEIGLILRAYIERFVSIKNEDCIEYILIFHNHGPRAGASVSHPHSQLIALPIIPPDVARSLDGSRLYFGKNKICAHCAILDFELSEKIRIIYENEEFVAFCPYAPRSSFEVRIYPRAHQAHFESINYETRKNLAAAFKAVLEKIRGAMNDPDYNFLIHTAPAKNNNEEHYHWHVEVLPRINIWAGLELGTGIVVVAVSPEEAAETLRNF